MTNGIKKAVKNLDRSVLRLTIIMMDGPKALVLLSILRIFREFCTTMVVIIYEKWITFGLTAVKL